MDLWVNKDNILNVSDSDIAKIEDQILAVYRLLNACKRIEYYMTEAKYTKYPNDTYLFGENQFKSDLYIDSILIEIQKLTETSSNKQKIFGIRMIKNLSNRLIRKYKVDSDNCNIFTIANGDRYVQQYQFISLCGDDFDEFERYSTFDLVNVQNKEMDKIYKDISRLKTLRSQIQAHSDFNVLKKTYEETYGNIDVNIILNNMANEDYLCGHAANDYFYNKNIGTDAAIINSFWDKLYDVYSLIRKALMRYTFILLSVYSRQRTKNSEIPVRALKFEDVQKIFETCYM